MSFIGLKVPGETARLLWNLWESDYTKFGEAEPREQAHITILHLGKDLPNDVLAKAILTAYSVTSTLQPFTVSTNRITVFPGGDRGTPIICPIDSPQLHELRQKLSESFDRDGIEYSKKFPEYKPHVTVAYANDPHEDWGSDIGFSKIEWGAHEAILWGGDHMDERLTVNFPFVLSPQRTAVRKSLVRAAMRENNEYCPKR